MENKQKRSYHFNVTEVEEGKIKEVMDFNFGGHHDLADMVRRTVAKGNITEKHAKELVTGLRLLHHVVKKYPENSMFKAFAPALEQFKESFKQSIE